MPVTTEIKYNKPANLAVLLFESIFKRHSGHDSQQGEHGRAGAIPPVADGGIAPALHELTLSQVH